MLPLRSRVRGSAAALGIVVFAALAPLLRAQSLDAAFNLATSAEVFGLAAQPDGKILLGGNFATVGGTPRSRLARLQPDGSLDAAFNPNANSTVYALTLQPDGKIVVVGAFTTVASTPHGRIARLHADGSLDNTFNPATDALAVTAAIQPDGKILVGGQFTQVSGAPRTALARLNADGSLDASFDAGVSGSLSLTAPTVVNAIALQPDGRILIGGYFTHVGGQPRSCLARLNVNGTLDATFTADATSDVQHLVVQPDGKILVGGSFTAINGAPRLHLARLAASGAPDSEVTTSLDAHVEAIGLRPDGKFVVAGSFLFAGSIRRERLARFNADGSLDLSFAADTSGSLGMSTPSIYALVLPGPEQVVIGGAFNSVAGQPRSGIARLGTPLPTIATQPANLIAAAGATAALNVVATGDNLRYQWERNGTPLPGATAATLVLDSLQTASAGSYRVVVTNPFGTTTSAVATVTLGAPPVPAYAFTTLAGSAGAPGHADGTGSAARFNRPTGVATDAAGNVYVADAGNNALRKITPTGVVTTLAAQAVWGLALDAAGNVFVADADARIFKLTPAGVVSTFAGSGLRGTADGNGGTAQFRGPRGVAVDAAGNVFVADSDNFTIRKITPAGVVSTWAGAAGVQGTVDGTLATARFSNPWGLAFDVAGNLYVADRTTVRRLSPTGAVTSLAPAGALGDVIGVAADAAGNVFAADVVGHTIRRLAPGGGISVIGGSNGASGSAEGTGSAARFNAPWSIAVDAGGALYVADNANATIRKGTPDTTPFGLTAPPASVHVAPGASPVLSVGAAGTALTYQWKKDGAPIPGATGAAYLLTSATAADTGLYSVVVTSAGGAAIESARAILTVAAAGTSGRIVNVSTRGFVPAGGALTPGFVLRGAGVKPLLVRGVGPTLLRFGLGGSLADPRLEILPLGGTTPVPANDNWSGADAALGATTTATGAFALETGSRDAATLAALDTAAGSGYTVRVFAADAAAAGLALAEIYDPETGENGPRLVNVSTRGFVGTGVNALVPGFVIRGGPKLVLVRAVGPGLAPFGVTGVLADPQLALIPLGQEAPLAANDNWSGDAELAAAFAAAGAFALPSDSKDAAVLIRLPPGGYTVNVSGAGGGTGIALIEVYDLDP